MLKGLRDSQVGDVEFLLSSPYAMLANEMRTGKTISTIAALHELDQWPVFVVASANLLRNWKAEFEKWAPDITIQTLFETKTIEEDLSQDAQVYLLPYSKLRAFSKHSYYPGLNKTQRQTYHKHKSPKLLNNISVKCIVVDECQEVIKPASQITRALWAFREQSDRIWVLSGTPLANYVDDMWSYLRLFDRKEWANRGDFRKMYIDGYYDHFQQYVVNGLNPATKDKLKSRLDDFMRRVNRSDIEDGAKNNFTLAEIELSPDQRQLYDHLEEHDYFKLGETPIVMQSMATKHLRKRQLCSGIFSTDKDLEMVVTQDSPKMVKLREIVQDVPRAVVACEFIATAKAAAEALNAPIISGDSSADEKHDIVDQFQSKKIDYVIATYGAGGVGITLSSADTMIRLERCYSLIKFKQMQDRIVSVGNGDVVNNYIDIVAADSVDGDVGSSINGKIENIRELIDYEA